MNPDLKRSGKQQVKNRRRPRVKFLADIHSRVHFCKNALLVMLKDGMNQIASRKSSPKEGPDHRYRLFCGDKELVHFSVNSSPTCASFLYNGYGDGILSMEECEAVRDRINGAYTNIRDAVKNIEPVLGLFKSGLYVVAEYELFPWHNDFFWNGSERIPQDYSYNNCRTPNSGERSYTDSPLYLYPTQRAGALDPERVDHYASRLGEGKSFPYAIAMYLVGDMALLLDGHHKATAAAMAGRPIKTLVIFRVDPENGLMEEVQRGTRLCLRHGKSIDQLGSLNLSKNGDVVLGELRGVDHWEKERLSAEAGVQGPKWGLVPEAYQGKETDYPSESLLYYGTLIPPDRIKEIYFRVYQNDDPGPLSLYCLQCFAKLFPESKFLSEKQRRWLANYNTLY